MQSVTLSDQEFLDAFHDRTLPAAQFDHCGHLRVAWLMLQRRPLTAAIEEICSGIASFATHAGAPDKYHRTLTEALVRLMVHGGAATLSWSDFQLRNPHLLHQARATLARHYSPKQLNTPLARRRFIPPDLQPLPACPS